MKTKNETPKKARDREAIDNRNIKPHYHNGKFSCNDFSIEDGADLQGSFTRRWGISSVPRIRGPSESG